MRTKIIGLLVLGLLAGCGSNGNNNGMSDGGGVGGNGGAGGSDGGGGGCSNQCAAGATRCADAGNEESCMPLNGCLQWVKTACSAAQVCKTGTGDMGSGGVCVTGVPCTCPSGFTCDHSGVCQGGDPSMIAIDVKTVNASGTITLNGAAPTTNPSCDPDPAAAKATVELVDTSRGYAFSLPVPCSSTTFAWSGVIFPGTYRVSVVGANDYSNLPNQSFVANAALTVGADIANVALDVKTVSVAGSVTLNGAAPITTADACSADPTAAAATVHFADATDGYAFDLDVPCSSATYGWGGSIFPGTYVVSVAGHDGFTTLPTAAFTSAGALTVSGAVANQVIAVTTRNVAGGITLNGAAPTTSANCSASPTANKAIVHLVDTKQGYAFDLPVLCSQADFAWSGAVYPGNYTASVDGQTAYSNLPEQSYVANSALTVSGDVSGQTLDVKTVNVSGTITLNGMTPPPSANCTATPTATQATVTLADAQHGYGFSFPVLCSSATLAWSGVVFPGSYRVSVTGGSSFYTTLPAQSFTAQPALNINSDVSGDVLDVKTANASGTITLDGATPGSSAACTNSPTSTKAQVSLTDATNGYAFSMAVPCSSSSFAWSGSLYPGTYQVRVAGAAAYSNVPAQPYLANSALVVPVGGNVTGQTLDVQTRNVGGSVTLNGAMPSTSTACNPSPTATKASVLMSDDADGYSFSIPVSCSSASFTFMGAVYPGTYRISVAGSNGYSNLPTQSYLGTPRLTVK